MTVRARAAAQLRLLLLLRLRMVFRGAGRGTGVRILLLLMALAALGIALLLGWAGWEGSRWLSAEEAAGRISGGSTAEWVHLSFLFVYSMLVLLPPLGFAGNEFYDVTKLFHLPVGHGTVFLAQTLGSLAGPTVWMFLPLLVGVVAGLPGGPADLAVRLLLLLLLLVNAVVISQLIQLAFLSVLRSRRFRDLAAVIAALLSAGLFVLFRVLAEAGDVRHQLKSLVGHRVSRYMLPLPPHWVSSGVAPGAEAARALPLLIALVAVTALAGLGAVALHRRAFFGEVPVGRPGRRAGRRARGEGRLSWPSWIPGAVRAVASREVLLIRRHPMVKTLLITQSVFLLSPLLFLALREHPGYHAPDAIGLGGLMLLFVESHLVLNLFGLEGVGAAQLLMTPVPARRLVGGKLLAYGTIFGTANLLLLAAAALAAALLGQPIGGLTLLVLAGGFVGGLLVMLGIGSVISVLLPSPLAARGRRSLSESQAGRTGCVTAMLRGLTFFLLLFLLVPLSLLAVEPALLPLGILYAAVLLTIGHHQGSRLLERRGEEFLAGLTHPPD